MFSLQSPPFSFSITSISLEVLVYQISFVWPVNLRSVLSYDQIGASMTSTEKLSFDVEVLLNFFFLF